MAPDGGLSTEVIRGVLSSGDSKGATYFLVHQGHMRLMTPLALSQPPPVVREVVAAGWECHLEAASGTEASVRARDYLLCPRCDAAQEVPQYARRRCWAFTSTAMPSQQKLVDGLLGTWS